VKAKIQQALQDLLEAAAAAGRLVERGKDAYDGDEMLRYAGEDLLIRLGETAHRVDRADVSFIAAHPELELRDLKDARNVAAHGYDIVDAEIVWEILAVHVPRVALRVRDLLESAPAPE
jgi:uncharacterized protein with HEPN domain